MDCYKLITFIHLKIDNELNNLLVFNVCAWSTFSIYLL